MYVYVHKQRERDARILGIPASAFALALAAPFTLASWLYRAFQINNERLHDFRVQFLGYNA
jgi:hypothetical protein